MGKGCLEHIDSEGPDQTAHLCSLIGPSLSAYKILGHYRIH